jgi:hypothetical protein
VELRQLQERQERLMETLTQIAAQHDERMDKLQQTLDAIQGHARPGHWALGGGALTRLQRVLVQDRTIQQMDLQGLRDFCTQLEATYSVDNGRDA